MSPKLSQQNRGSPEIASALSCVHKQQLGNLSLSIERMLGGTASKISSILESLGILPQDRREDWGLGKHKSQPERGLSG